MTAAENAPTLWLAQFPFPGRDDHKYSRGTALIRGGAVMTGAARLAARAAQRMGAGLVTLAAPASALPIYARALESVIVREADGPDAWRALVNDARAPALLIGPGLGRDAAQADEVLTALAARRPAVLDADALSLFENRREDFFAALHDACVLTPHEGEFARLFPDLTVGDKTARACAAAARAGCVVLLKGSDTVIAAPDGACIVNRAAPPWLATAGAGDVLAGMVLGLVAQSMPVFQATAAAAWCHARAAELFGPGLIAEDIVATLPRVLQELIKT